MIRRRRHSETRPHGFTLVEVLVTLVLMGIVLPVAMRGIQISISASSYARRAAEAAMLGQSKLNEIVAIIQTQQSNTLGSAGDFGQQWPAYTWTYEETYNTDLAVIEAVLTVHWVDPKGPREIRFATIVVDSATVEETAAAAAALET